ncbi:trp RNA-binding attenuation protein MtrB [Paenibacillus glucanolyticus]|uniref:trp RNA-binding attenuation protein MtrB n=1 Tax=Paenibacillus glucanolyticus TaxID=59843 RepID=UPI003D075964
MARRREVPYSKVFLPLKNTRFHHTEKLDKGEVIIAQFTDHTSAVKIRGKAEVMTKHGKIESGS